MVMIMMMMMMMMMMILSNFICPITGNVFTDTFKKKRKIHAKTHDTCHMTQVQTDGDDAVSQMFLHGSGPIHSVCMGATLY